jgi:NADH-quinone oxidoreductase subunit L
MTVPLLVLAVLSVVGGWVGIPHFMGGGAHFSEWLAPVFASDHAATVHEVATIGSEGHAAVGHAVEAAAHGAAAVHHDTTMEWVLAAASLAWGVLGLVAGWFVYARRASLTDAMRRLAGGVPYRILHNKYYVDEAYEGAFIRPGFRLSRAVLWKVVDVGVIDGLIVNGSALAISIVGSVLRLFQNGMVRFYAWSIALGVTVFVLYLTFAG